MAVANLCHTGGKYVVRYFSVRSALSLNTRLIRFVQGFERSSLTRADT